MAKDLADYQAEAIANGYTHNFGFDERSTPSNIENKLRIVEYVSFDSGTDPGDDVTMYLIESKGYPFSSTTPYMLCLSLPTI